MRWRGLDSDSSSHAKNTPGSLAFPSRGPFQWGACPMIGKSLGIDPRDRGDSAVGGSGRLSVS